ncbi:MAG: helix-turn-helix domain-containing protein [Propionivibrio sp.]
MDLSRAAATGQITAGLYATDQGRLRPRNLRTRCFEEIGCSPMQWVRRLRLERARLLRAAGISVAKAAARAGYARHRRSTAALRRLTRR